MPVRFDQSETRINLMRAFAGESQARNRYTFAAGLAQKKNLQVIQGVFLFTAGQEEQHAKIYYNLLEQLSGQSVKIDGDYPVDIFPELLPLLRSAQHNEYQEWEHDYRHLAEVAQQEELPEISHIFNSIAEIEKSHGDRFGKFADLMESNRLFVSDVECKWMCLNCGHVAQTAAAPLVCPVCKHPQGFFIRWEMSPYSQ